MLPLTEVYAHFRKEDNFTKHCTDMIMVVVPGAREDAPGNKPLEVAHKGLRTLNPKHINPKIGDIQLLPTDVLPGSAASRRNVQPKS